MINKNSFFCILTGILFASNPSYAEASDSSQMEIILRPSYGSAGSKSPVNYTNSNGSTVFQVGNIFNGTSMPYGGGFIGEAGAGYRINSNLSIGLTGSTRTSSTSDPGDGTTNLSRSALSIGPYMRFYFPLLTSFETYFSAGLSYVHDVQTYRYLIGVAADGADWTVTHYGLGIPLSIGASYHVWNFLNIGPFFQLTPVLGLMGRQQATAPNYIPLDRSSSDSAPSTTVSNYLVWSAGVDFRLTLF